MAGEANTDRLARTWALCLAALVVLAAALAAPAAAGAGQLLEVVGPGGADSGDCVAAPCATIGYAVAQAEPGDTVRIAAGGYDEQLTIAKPLILEGDPAGGTRIGPAGDAGIVAGSELTLAAGAGGTVLRDLEVTSRAQYEPAIATSGGTIDDVTIERVAVRGIGPSVLPTTVAAGLEISVPASGWTIRDSSFEDNYAGLLVSGDASELTIEGSSFDRNRNGLYVARSLPLGPGSTGTIDGLLLTDSEFAANQYRGLYFEGLSDATIAAITVTGTGEGMASLPMGARALQLNLKAGDFGDVTVSGSTFSGSVNEGVLVMARGAASDSAAYQAAPATLHSFRLLDSTVTGNGGPGIAVENEPNLESISITASRIVGNGNQSLSASTPVSGIFGWREGGGATPVEAAGNWFGCNAGPFAAGSACDTANAPAAASPWLVLTAAASPATLGLGDSASLVAAIDTNSAGQPAAAVPAGTPVSFAATSGSISPASAALLGGSATANFSPSSPGDPGLTVAVDGERVAVPITVLAPVPPPTEPPPPPVQSPPGASPPPPPPPASVEPSGAGRPKVVAANGSVSVATIDCAAASCEIEAAKPTLKVGGRSFAVRVRVPGSIAGGESAPLRVLLPKAAREALAERGRGRVRVKVTVTAADGTTREVTVTVVIKAKRQRGR